MIKLTSVRIKDFGRHKLIQQQIKGHVVGLTGPNGDGKTTVLQALELALRGTIDHEDPLSSFIRRTDIDPPKAAEVEWGFEADGRKGRILRRITRTKTSRELWWDGVDAIQPSECLLINDLIGKSLANADSRLRGIEQSQADCVTGSGDRSRVIDGDGRRLPR